MPTTFKQFITEKLDFKKQYQQWVEDNFKFGIEIEGYVPLLPNKEKSKIGIKEEKVSYQIDVNSLDIWNLLRKIRAIIGEVNTRVDKAIRIRPIMVYYERLLNEVKTLNINFDSILPDTAVNINEIKLTDETIKAVRDKSLEKFIDGLDELFPGISINEIYSPLIECFELIFFYYNKTDEAANTMLVDNFFEIWSYYQNTMSKKWIKNNQISNLMLASVNYDFYEGKVDIKFKYYKIGEGNFVFATGEPTTKYDYVEKLKVNLKNKYYNIIDEVTTDGSLNQGYGVEIICGKSPEFLKYSELVKDVNTLLEELKQKYNMIFNEDVGLHISFSSPLIKNVTDVDWLKVSMLGGLDEVTDYYGRENNRFTKGFRNMIIELYNKTHDQGKVRRLGNFSGADPKYGNKIVKDSNLLSYAIRLMKFNKLSYGKFKKIVPGLSKAFFYRTMNGVSEVAKHSIIKLSDFYDRGGRIELRAFGGDAANDYNTVIEQLDNIMNSIKISITDEYEEEYHWQLFDRINKILEKIP